MSDKKKVLLSRERDKSFEAFKDWINELFTHITGRPASDEEMTEEQWIRAYRKYRGIPDDAEPETGETNA